MDADQIYQVVKKLIGEIRPAGAAHIDPERLINLQVTCRLIEKLHADVDGVAWDFRNRNEHSVKQAVEVANKYINGMGIKE